jgi:hypothetical protein
MKFFTITAVSNFINRPHVKSFHANMFHGLAERGGKEWPHDPKVWASSAPSSPLLISRTFRNVPEVFRPSRHLVVSERLAAALRQFTNIRLAPVIFKRLVDVDYRKGDMSWAQIWGNVDPCELLKTLPDVRDFHRQIGAYFEVQAYRWRDFIDQYPSATEITIEEGTPPFQKANVLRVSVEMLNDYPIFWWGSIFVNQDVFKILQSSLDRDFFITRTYKVA